MGVGPGETGPELELEWELDCVLDSQTEPELPAALPKWAITAKKIKTKTKTTADGDGRSSDIGARTVRLGMSTLHIKINEI